VGYENRGEDRKKKVVGTKPELISHTHHLEMKGSPRLFKRDPKSYHLAIV